MIQQVTRRTAMRYDRDDDHYDIVSAYQKSMRGSAGCGAPLSSPAAGSRGSASACRSAHGVRLRGCGPCLPADHPHRKGGGYRNAVGLPSAAPPADAVVLVATSPKSNSAHVMPSTPPLQMCRPHQAHSRQLQNKHYATRMRW